MPKSAPFKHGRKTCIFCGGAANSGEHVWPKWAHSLLPAFSRHEQITLEGPVEKTVLSRVRHRRRQGSSAKVAIKRVCKSCNSGWMGNYEEKLKLTLTRMMIGSHLAIGPDTQILLREYFTYKIMVLDWTNDDPVFSDKERSEFFLNRTIPEDLKVIISYCPEQSTQSYYRTHFMEMASLDSIQSRTPGRNVKTFAIGFGSIFVFALYVKGSSVPIDLLPRPFWFQIIPQNLLLFYWPPLRPINRREAEGVASSLGSIKAHPSVHLAQDG